MKVLITNCFHWIGYHYVNHFLEKGMEVGGIDTIDTEKKEHLSLFLGRNSSFTLLEREENTYDIVIQIDDGSLCSNKTPKTFMICTKPPKHVKNTNCVLLYSPMLFGEWMDMTEDGVIWNEKLIPFNSKEFQKKAVYIEDFLDATYPIMTGTTILRDLTLISKKNFQDRAVKLENSIYIRDNVPIEVNVENVKAHFQRFKNLY
ncbi:hypothetical protein [Ornithinibacillus contaminans]|uniref:hypothetical protein n=1 Tax=Ornithinibacillus contaminans TaxID=694055 RepID=UPI00064E0578|nr:hypothetical protein [Ornithinibacillus contaminans]